MRRAASFLVLVALGSLATMPGALHLVALRSAARFSNALAWWASIVLAALPFVAAGAVAGALLERLPQRVRKYGALALVATPGCDCAGSGYASAMVAEPPAIAGFALTWSAAAGPAALLATHAVLGTRLLVARLAGAAVASLLTAGAWQVDALMHRRKTFAGAPAHGHARTPVASSVCLNVASALGALSMCALVATIALSFLDGALHALSSPAVAAVVGAFLSPCSTSDAVLARVLVRDGSAQAAFVIAAQTFDVRQMATIARSFGARRAMLAAFAGVAGCAAAALVAR